MIQERLILAIPAGPEEFESPEGRHSTGSKLSIPTHNFLRKGLDMDYSLSGGYYALVEDQPIELAEFKGADIPRDIAQGGRVKFGIVGWDHVLNLPAGQRRQVEVVRKLGYGNCEFRLGVPMGQGYPGIDGEISVLEDVAGLRVATALPVLAQRKFDERGISVTIVPRNGHVENAIRYHLADAIVDITVTGGTMLKHGIRPAESLEQFEAVLIANRSWMQEAGSQKIVNRLLSRIDRALKNPNTWMNENNPGSNPIDFSAAQIVMAQPPTQTTQVIAS